MSAETRQFLKYLYELFNYFCFFFSKFYFVAKPERPIATVPLVRPGWTICCKFLQLINSIDISFRHKPRSNPTDPHTKPMLYFKPISFYSYKIESVLQYRNQNPSTSGSTPPVSKLQRSPTQKLLEHSSVDNCDFSAL